MRTRSRSRSDVGLSRSTSKRESDYRKDSKISAPNGNRSGRRNSDASQSSRGSASSDRRAVNKINSYRSSGRTQQREDSADSQPKRKYPSILA